MMRESVSHPQHKLFWGALLSVGTLTVLTGIGILIALMNPETIRTAPTIALVCVLILLCVPAPVLLLERSDRKAARRRAHAIPQEPAQRESVFHSSHHSAHQSTESAQRHHRTLQERPSTRSTEYSKSAS